MDVDPKPCVGALKITVEGVVKQLNSLNPYKASGPDRIPSYSSDIDIFQEPVDTGTVSDQWKGSYNIFSNFKKTEEIRPN